MKTRYIFLLICMTSFLLVTCKKDDNESASQEFTTPYQPGQVLTYSFIVDQDTVVKMQDQVIDYGVANYPVLMLVHKETLIKKPGWGSIFYPLMKDRLDSILVLWAQKYSLAYNTPEEKAIVARDFLEFIVSHNLDVGVFVDLVLWNHGSKLGPMMDVVTYAEKHGKSPNDVMYTMISANTPPEKALMELKAGDQWIEFLCMMLVTHVVEIGTKIFEIYVENLPVTNFENNYMSFVCLGDTILSDYTGGTPFTSRLYHLSYDAGLWEAKCTYHIEGIYGATSPVCAGKFLTHCNTIPDTAHVRGPKFIVEGNATYSPPINTGSFDVPIAEMNGKVQVTYGDCCCFRKYSILNFKINAGTGYNETTFDPGK